jgi:hypothetical protein
MDWAVEDTIAQSAQSHIVTPVWWVDANHIP